MSEEPTDADLYQFHLDTNRDNTSIFDKQWIDSYKKTVHFRWGFMGQPHEWKILFTKKGASIKVVAISPGGSTVRDSLNISGRILLLQDLCIIQVVREIKKNPENYEPFGTCFSKIPKALEILPSGLKEMIESQLETISLCYHCDKLKPGPFILCQSCGQRFCAFKVCSNFVKFAECEQCESTSKCKDGSKKRRLEIDRI